MNRIRNINTLAKRRSMRRRSAGLTEKHMNALKIKVKRKKDKNKFYEEEKKDYNYQDSSRSKSTCNSGYSNSGSDGSYYSSSVSI